MKLSDILLIAAAVLAAVALAGAWLNKRRPEKAKDPDKACENAVDLHDRFCRARPQNEDARQVDSK